MTSYAPLFENSNDRTWPVNLIWINSSQVIGRSSYYVQKMMAENRPSYNLKTDLTPRPVESLKFQADGKVGAGTWITQAEYKDFKISATGGNVDKPVIREMEKLNDEWTITDSSAAQTSDKTMTALMYNKEFTGSYTLELKARKAGGAEGFLIYFGMSDQNKKGYLVNIGGWLNTKTALETVQGGSNTVVSEMPPQHIEAGKWYDIKVAVTSQGVEVWVDGSMILQYKPVSSLHQFTVSGYDEATGEVIIKVVNADEAPWKSSVTISNGGKVAKIGDVITLASNSLEDENSFENPLKISPELAKYDQFGSEFIYEFKPRSFTVFRIKVSK
jgi:alpha-N-arabinofuranosidase